MRCIDKFQYITGVELIFHSNRKSFFHVMEFPTDILKYIFSFLEVEDLALARLVCHRWKKIIPAPIAVTCIDYVKYPHVLQWARLHGCPWDLCHEWTSEAMCRAIEVYDLPTLEWMVNHGAQYSRECLDTALSAGRPLEILDFVFRGLSEEKRTDIPLVVPPIKLGVNDPVSLLEWLRNKRFCMYLAINQVIGTMQEQRDTRILDVVRWVISHELATPDIKTSIIHQICSGWPVEYFAEALKLLSITIDSELFARAAKHGKREIIEYLISLGFAWDAVSIAGALERGHFELAKCALEKYRRSHSPYKFAIKSGSPQVCEMLDWMEAKGYRLNLLDNSLELALASCLYPVSVEVITWLVQRGYPKTVNFLPNTSDLRTLRWLNTNGYTFTFDEGRLLGWRNMVVFEFMLELGRDVRPDWYRLAAYKGRLDLIKVMYERDRPIQDWIPLMISDAVRGQRIEVLEWMHSQGFDLPYEALEELALTFERIEVIRWLRTHL